MKQTIEKKRLGANNNAKVWEQFPDIFGEHFFRDFQILKTRISKISDRLSGPMNILGKSDCFIFVCVKMCFSWIIFFFRE